MGVFLYILSQLLGILLFPVGMLWGLVECFINHRFTTGIRSADRKFFILAASFDKYGNVVCADLFNRVLITGKSHHRFGRIEHTISLVIGWNLLAGTLSPAGRLLNRVLDFFDPGHALKTVEAYKDPQMPVLSGGGW